MCSGLRLRSTEGSSVRPNGNASTPAANQNTSTGITIPDEYRNGFGGTPQSDVDGSSRTVISASNTSTRSIAKSTSVPEEDLFAKWNNFSDEVSRFETDLEFNRLINLELEPLDFSFNNLEIPSNYDFTVSDSSHLETVFSTTWDIVSDGLSSFGSKLADNPVETLGGMWLEGVGSAGRLLGNTVGLLSGLSPKGMNPKVAAYWSGIGDDISGLASLGYGAVFDNDPTAQGTLLPMAAMMAVAREVPSVKKNDWISQLPADQKAIILDRFNQGNMFESDVLGAKGIDANYDRIYTQNPDIAQDYAVPDALSTSRITEIKDVKELSISDQFRIYEESSMPIDLIVSPKNEIISKPLRDLIQDSGGGINIYNPNSGLFHQFDFETGAYNINGVK